MNDIQASSVEDRGSDARHDVGLGLVDDVTTAADRDVGFTRTRTHVIAVVRLFFVRSLFHSSLCDRCDVVYLDKRLANTDWFVNRQQGWLMQQLVANECVQSPTELVGCSLFLIHPPKWLGFILYYIFFNSEVRPHFTTAAPVMHTAVHRLCVLAWRCLHGAASTYLLVTPSWLVALAVVADVDAQHCLRSNSSSTLQCALPVSSVSTTALSTN